MGYKDEGADWQACGVAQVGVVVGVGAGLYIFEFRSKVANTRAKYTFLSVGFGLGGSLGGGVAPSPVDVAKNRLPEIWSDVKCSRPFSLEDLNHSYGVLETIGAAGAIGYYATRISAGWATKLFDQQVTSGWGTGVGIIGAVLSGVWTGWQMSDYY